MIDLNNLNNDVMIGSEKMSESIKTISLSEPVKDGELTKLFNEPKTIREENTVEEVSLVDLDALPESDKDILDVHKVLLKNKDVEVKDVENKDLQLDKQDTEKQSFNKMKVDDLRKIANEKKIASEKEVNKMKKKDLVDLISNI